MAGGVGEQDLFALRDCLSADFHVVCGDSWDARVRDAEEAQQLFDGLVGVFGVDSEPFELVGVGEQRQGADGEHVRGGLVSCGQQQPGLLQDADGAVDVAALSFLLGHGVVGPPQRRGHDPRFQQRVAGKQGGDLVAGAHMQIRGRGVGQQCA